MRAHAASRRRMPPMLHIALAELTRRAQQQMLAHQLRLGMDERHRVLQLIAETEGAARLIESAARPHAARQRLIEQPAIGQDIERSGRAFPPAPRRACGSSTARPPPARHAPPQRRGSVAPARCASFASRPTPSVKTISRSCPSASSNGTCIAAQGSRPAPTLPESRARVIAAGFRSVPLRPRNSVRSPVTLRVGFVCIDERDPVGELGVVRIAREQRAAVGVDFGDHVHQRFRPQIAQHPFTYPVTESRRDRPDSLRSLMHRELDRRIERDINPQSRSGCRPRCARTRCSRIRGG